MKYSALIGNPVEHSVSPKLFQIIMENLGQEYAHLKIKVEKNNFKKNIYKLFDLGFCGINITCPYKLDAYNLVDVFLDGSDKIHSINTIYRKDSLIYGCNTDGKAAIKSINRELEMNNSTKIVLYGAGGAAYSILYEISQLTNNITIINHKNEEIEMMLDALNLSYEYFNLKDKEKYIEKLFEADLIINATSLGMYPNNDSIIDRKIIRKIPNGKVFFDVVFNPWETKMIKYAKKENNKTISGGYMLIYQAILALEKWLSCEIDLDEKTIKMIEKKMKREIKRIS